MRLAELEARIGRTPERRFRVVLSDGRSVTVVMKDEGGQQLSAKLRAVLNFLVRRLRRGEIRPGNRIVLSTSGNTGVAAAIVGRAIGVSVTLIVDENIQPEYAEQARAAGADIEYVTEADENGNFLAARIRRMDKFGRLDGVSVLDQYTHPDFPDGYTESLGREIFEHGEPDAVFVAVSTGGTLSGIAGWARTFHPSTRLVAVDVDGSVALPGGVAGKRYLSGVGASRPSFHLNKAHQYDDIVRVSERAAVAACHTFEEAIGLRIGGSGGAVLAAAARYLLDHPDVERPYLVMHDSGGYSQTVYDHRWLRDRGLTPRLDDLDAITRITH